MNSSRDGMGDCDLVITYFILLITGDLSYFTVRRKRLENLQERKKERCGMIPSLSFLKFHQCAIMTSCWLLQEGRGTPPPHTRAAMLGRG